MSAEYIATLDIGTTNIRCHIIDSKAQTVGSASIHLTIIRPKPGYIEIEPDSFFKSVVELVRQAVLDAKLQLNQIKCLSIAVQRSTFITWKKNSGEYLHNFITWNDMRATDLIKKANESSQMKLMQTGASLVNIMHLGRSGRYSTASRIKITNTQCTGRLLWVMRNLPEIEKQMKNENVCFATLDSWLIYQLTGKQKFVSDISSASSTGLYDPFKLAWSDWPHYLFGIPLHIFPTVVGNDYDFGTTDPKIFGIPIKIASVIGDQQAALFGSCCFKDNSAKITMGTGSFIDINTGKGATAGSENFYPLVGWKLDGKTTFLRESACKDAGTLIEWALRVGIATDKSSIDKQVFAVHDTDGVFFIPAFSGLPPPMADENAATGFIGVKATTTKDHLLRAILESIVFTIISAYNIMVSHSENNFKEILIAGGVARSIFICQSLADMTEKKIVRYTSQEQTVLGAAFMAGLNAGIWKDFEELSNLQTIDKVFQPNTDRRNDLYLKLELWQTAAKRFTGWY